MSNGGGERTNAVLRVLRRPFTTVMVRKGWGNGGVVCCQCQRERLSRLSQRQNRKNTMNDPACDRQPAKKASATMKHAHSYGKVENTIYSDGRRIIALSRVPSPVNGQTGPFNGSSFFNQGSGWDTGKPLPLDGLSPFQPEIRPSRPAKRPVSLQPRLQLQRLP